MTPTADMPVVEIDLDHRGMGSVKINGQNVASGTFSTTIVTEAGKPSKVILGLWSHELKVRLPAEVIMEVRESIPRDYEAESRILDKVLDSAMRYLREETEEAENRIVERVLDRMNRKIQERR